jgi:hypothetical protein
MIVPDSNVKYTKIIDSKDKQDEFSLDVDDENTYFLAKTYCEEELINCKYKNWILLSLREK